MEDRGTIVRRLSSMLGGSGLPPLLLRFWRWIAISTVCSLVYTATLIGVLHNTFAYGILGLWNDSFWWDFWVFEERFQFFRKPEFWNSFRYPFTYPPAMAILFAMLYRIPHILRIYLIGCCAGPALWAWMVARQLRTRGGVRLGVALAFTVTIALTAWPVALELSAANTEGILAVILAAGVWAVLCRHPWLGATLIAVAGALKIFPLALLALLFTRRRYPEFACGLVLAGVFTVGSLAVLGPTIPEAAHHIAAGLNFVKYTYALAVSRHMPDVSHSLFSPIKFTLVVMNRVMHPTTWQASQAALLERAYQVYVPAVSLFGAALYLGKIRGLPMLNQVFALTILAVWLPPFSVDYTLLNLLLPLGLLLVYVAEMNRQRIAVPGLRAAMICFAILYPVGSFFILKYRFGSMVRAVVLGALLVVVLRSPWPWRAVDDEALLPGAVRS